MGTGEVEIRPFLCVGNGLRWTERKESSALFLWIRTGSGSITSGEDSRSVRPYSLICFGKDCLLQTPNRISGYCLQVAFDFIKSCFQGSTLRMLDEFLQQLGQPVLFIQFSRQARSEAEWLLQHTLREDGKPQELFWTSVKFTVGQFLLLCYEQWLAEGTEKETVSASAETVVKLLCNYIDGHLNEDFGLRQLSQRAGYAPSYFSSLFSKVYGHGLTEYISRRRIALAQHLLSSTNVKVVEICLRVGFKDLAHFNRTFKRFVGMTPNQYRQLAECRGIHEVDVPPIPCERTEGLRSMFRPVRMSV